MGAGTLVSRLLGMVRDMVLAAQFSRQVTDAFVVAFRLPNLLRRILGEGVLNASFVPMFIQKQQSPQKKDDGFYFACAVGAFLWVFAVVLCGFVIIFAPQLVQALVGGDTYVSTPGKMELTIRYTRWLFGYFFLVSNYAFFMAVLNARGKFFWPAIAPAGFNLSFIVWALMPQEWFGNSMNLVWGVLLGGALQLSICLGALHARAKYAFKGFSLKKILEQTAALKKFLATLAPAACAMGVVQLMGLVNTYYASFLSPGTHSYIYWGDRVMDLPLSLVATSLGVALLPTLSKLSAPSSRREFLQISSHNLCAVLYLILPASVGLLLLGPLLAEVLFKRGQFDQNDLVQTGLVIRLYSIFLIITSVHKIIAAGFFALKNTWLPSLFTALALVVHMMLAPFFMELWQLKGLILSMALSAGVNASALIYFYTRRIGVLDIKRIGQSLLGQALPLLALAVGAGLFLQFVPHLRAIGALTLIVGSGLSIAMLAMGYLGLSHALKHPVGCGINNQLIKGLIKFSGVERRR